MDIKRSPCRVGVRPQTPDPRPQTQDAERRTLNETIDRLTAENEKHRWISVSDKLPEINKEVLVIIKNPFSICSGHKDAYGDGFNIGVGKVYYPLRFITHWKLIILPEQALKDREQKSTRAQEQRK